MSHLQCAILIILSSVFPGLSQKLCGNGVFKCTSPSTLKICFNGLLVGSEFLCPNSTICCETSESICSTIPDPSCHDYEYEPSNAELDAALSDIKAKPDEPGTAPICVAAGKFPVLNTACKNYLMCIKSPTGFREKQMSCYGEKLFDPVTELCSDSYVCPEPAQSTPAPFCQEQGKYPVLDTGCKNYIMCTETTTGFREKAMSCYGAKLFDPETQLCSDSYICPEEMPSTPAAFCQEQGKYPVLDTGCKNYIMCTETSTGFREKPMSCYGEKLFDPETGLCSDTYICPEPTPSTPAPFCQEQGKFPLPNSKCTKYINCIKSTTGFREKEMSCYGEKLFDPITGLCSDSYICEELITSTTEVTPGKSNSTDDCINPEPTTTFQPTVTTTTTSSITEVTPDKSNSTDDCIYPESTTTIQPTVTTTTTSSITEVTPDKSNSTDDCIKPEPTTTFQPTVTTTTTSSITEVTPGKSNSTDDWLNPEPTTTFQPTATVPVPPLPFCDKMGKFSIPNTECTQYLFCVKTSTGFQGKVYNCPLNSYFNPNTSKCSITYICPDIITTTVNPHNITEDTTYSTITTSEDFTPSVTSTPQFNSTPSVTNSPGISITPDSTTVSDSIIITDKTTPDRTHTPVVTTPSQTHLPDITSTQVSTTTNTPDTTTAKLNTSSDSTISDVTSTPDNSKLTTTPDPDTSQNTTITSEISITTGSTTHEITATPDTTTTLKSTTSDITTLNPSTTTNSTPIPTCQVQGKHAIPGTKCTKYLMCLATTTGFWSMQYTCPSGSLFDPDQKLCTVNYLCSETEPAKTTEAIFTSPVTVSTTTNSATTEIPFCEKQGMFPVSSTNCKKYLLCIMTVEGLWGRIYECLPDTSYDPVLSQCTKTYECEDSIPTTTEVAKPTEIPECIDQGRIYVPDTGCKQYLLCSLTRSGFKSQVYSCPPATYFNSEDGRCYSDFICPELKSITQNSDVTTCATVGRFPDPQDKNCEYYYNCTEVTTNSIEGIKQKCNSGYYFDAKTQECSKNYVCQHESDMKTFAMKVISPRFLMDDECTTIGRREVSGSKCKNYILCSANTDGTLKATKFTCPTTTLFNPVIQKCTAQYICPHNICYQPGWIPNPNVKDCKSYISCEPTSDNMGNIIYDGHVINCPSGCKFNPVMGCSPNYVCPN